MHSGTEPFDAVAVPDQAAIVGKREAANGEMAAYLTALVQRRASELEAGQRGHDPVTRLLRLALSGAVKFPVERVVLNVGGLLIGAVETTSHAVVNALEFLLRDPDRLAEARAAAQSGDTARFDGFVFEALRFRPAFSYTFRTVEQDTTLCRGADQEMTIPAARPFWQTYPRRNV